MDELSKKNLSTLREKIDHIDSDLLKLLNQRASHSIEIGKLKKKESNPVFCHPDREAEIIKNIIKENNGPLEHKSLEKLFKLIFTISCDLQKKA